MKLNIKNISIDDPVKAASNIRARTGISDEEVSKVKAIMDNVMQNGDQAVLNYTKNFDNVELDSILVNSNEIDYAYRLVGKEQVKALKEIKRRLEVAERSVINKLKNIEVRIDGTRISKLLKPVESAGCYVPGGRARYPSTLVMCVVPAKVAGVKRIAVCSPPAKNGTIDPLTLVAADLCGVNEVYKIGGAQSIAAMAYGTETIKPVSKIVGPGSSVVTTAKALASSKVPIDMLAGPTELLVFADEEAHARSIVLDIISQCEHGVDTLCGLITSSKRLADIIVTELCSVIDEIDRGDIVRKSLEKKGFIALCRNNADAIKFINEFAPEHLQVVVKNAKSTSRRIESAGLILVGEYSPSAASDYGLGSNHVLPTLAYAKSRASLSCLDFVKLLNIVESSRTGLKKIIKAVKLLSEAEHLPNHYQAILERLK
ncbi:MAG: histidinol dehydrogenase [Nitrososphaerales archaeon]